ncbi:MAG: type II secretion system F family protein [Paucimonas sp.]|jgi:tight adherence protein C|nr:type II secretion system F family protein [Paucimonas sp.]
MALLISAGLLFLTFLLLVSVLARQHRRERLVTLRLQGEQSQVSSENGWMERLGKSALAQRSMNLDSETRVLLDRIGWRRTRQRSLYAALQVGVPLLALGIALLFQKLFLAGGSTPWLWPTMALGLGYLLPKRTLAWVAARRQRQIADEVSSFIPLLRILFDSGLAVEQSLRILSIEGRQLLPVLSEELRLILVRVDSGLALSSELEQTARLLSVDEFSDTCVILQQLLTQGGGAMKSLLALKQLLDDRRLTRLQERVSKMSGKMSVVMMVFLFPALLIVLAGPGLSALARVFGS